MARMLEATGVATVIHDALAGGKRKADLGAWAYKQPLDHDNGVLEFPQFQRYAIAKALVKLTIMAEGPEYDLSDEELEALASQLDR